MAYRRRVRKPLAARRTVRRRVSTRFFRRRRAIGRPYARGPKDLFPPTKTFIMHYYKFNEKVTTTSGAMSYFSYRVNSLYDPEVAVGGGQPRYFDTLFGADDTEAPYQRYRVYGCRIDATIQTINGNACTVAVGARDSIRQQPENINSAATDPAYSVRVLGGNQGNRAVVHIRKYVTMSRLFGVPKGAISGDSAYSGTYAASPTHEGYWDVLFMNNSLTGSDYYLNVKLTYYGKAFIMNTVPDS